MMKNQWVIIVLAAMLPGLGSLSQVRASEVVVAVPGISIVQDVAGDMQIRTCDPFYPDTPCSIPPGAPLDLPGYFDIRKASITQVGKGLVDLSIQLYEPIPAAPAYPFVNYYWQFDGGCVTGEPGDKDAISITWRDWGSGIWEWRARWNVITSCNPRTFEAGDPVPFKLTEDGVKVRVSLAEFLTATDETGTLTWFAGIRRMAFTHPTFTHTVPVDVAPDVIAFNFDPPLIYPEDPATWEPRLSKDLNPVVMITSPTSNPHYTTSSSSLTLGGTASDNGGVHQVTWTNDRGGSGGCNGTTLWSCTGITLWSGQNVITVTALDGDGLPGADTLTVTLAASDPGPSGSVVINGDAVSTDTPSVTLALAASDTHGVAQMCISNATSCTAWEPYATTKPWTLLSDSGGVKTVYAWFRDGLGHTNPKPYSDSIILNVFVIVK